MADLLIDPDFWELPALEPEQELIVAVIDRAFQDIDLMLSQPGTPLQTSNGISKSKVIEANGRDAIRFLFQPSGLDDLAHIADIDPDVVRRYALQKFPQYRRMSCSTTL